MAEDVCQHTKTTTDGQKLVCGQVHNPKLCKGHANVRENPNDRSSRIIGIRPCLRPPLVGMKVCRAHGGAAQQAKAKAAERIEQAKAENAVITFGLPREVDPRDALLEEVYRTAGAVDWLHQQVQALKAKDVIWGKTEEVEKSATEFAGTDVTHKAAVHVWVELWQKERLHLVRVAKEAIAAGIEERKVRLAEQQGALLAGVIKAILGDLNLSPEQQAKVATVVPLRLREVANAA